MYNTLLTKSSQVILFDFNNEYTVNMLYFIATRDKITFVLFSLKVIWDRWINNLYLLWQTHALCSCCCYLRLSHSSEALSLEIFTVNFFHNPVGLCCCDGWRLILRREIQLSMDCVIWEIKRCALLNTAYLLRTSLFTFLPPGRMLK